MFDIQIHDVEERIAPVTQAMMAGAGGCHMSGGCHAAAEAPQTGGCHMGAEVSGGCHMSGGCHAPND